jgi:hypothetical protein
MPVGVKLLNGLLDYEVKNHNDNGILAQNLI